MGHSDVPFEDRVFGQGDLVRENDTKDRAARDR
jgi:hypothetical protein